MAWEQAFKTFTNGNKFIFNEVSWPNKKNKTGKLKFISNLTTSQVRIRLESLGPKVTNKGHRYRETKTSENSFETTDLKIKERRQEERIGRGFLNTSKVLCRVSMFRHLSSAWVLLATFALLNSQLSSSLSNFYIQWPLCIFHSSLFDL